jgi:hypothetical protein
MKTALLDINVILDWLEMRPEYEQAVELVNQCALGKTIGYLCAHEVTTLSYFLFKNLKNKEMAVNIIARVLNMFTIIALDANILEHALHSAMADYEDAVIEQSALDTQIDYIVTRNLKDFAASSVPALSPSAFLALAANE